MLAHAIHPAASGPPRRVQLTRAIALCRPSRSIFAHLAYISRTSIRSAVLHLLAFHPAARHFCMMPTPAAARRFIIRLALHRVLDGSAIPPQPWPRPRTPSSIVPRCAAAAASPTADPVASDRTAAHLLTHTHTHTHTLSECLSPFRLLCFLLQSRSTGAPRSRAVRPSTTQRRLASIGRRRFPAPPPTAGRRPAAPNATCNAVDAGVSPAQ